MASFTYTLQSRSSPVVVSIGPIVDWLALVCATGAANYMAPPFTYAASLPPSLQSPAAAAASLPLSHYAAQSQLQEARMQ